MVKQYKQSPVYFTAFHYLSVVLLFIFVAVHAFTMFITHDEAFSFFLIRGEHFKMLSGTANTHWLNSFFMKLFNLIFGDAPGWLRLHSVIAFPFFAFGIFRISGYIQHIFLRLTLYCLILFNPFILDFFSLARGYGLALTFQVWMMLFFIKAVSENEFNYKIWIRVFICCMLCIAANLSFFYSVISIAGYFFYLIVKTNKSGYTIKAGPVKLIAALFSSVLLFTIADLLIIKFFGKDLEFGGDSNLIGSLIGSVWEGSFYFSDHSPHTITLLAYISFFLLVLAMLYFLFNSIKNKRPDKYILLSLPVISILLLNIIFHLFFKTPFLLSRTALQWFPLGMVLLFLFFDCITRNIKTADWQPVLLHTFICSFIILHFIRQADIHYSFEWQKLAESRNCLSDLSNIHPNNAAVHNWLNGVYTNYYKLTDSTIAKIPISFIDERKLTDCNSAAFKKFLTYDYVIISSAVTIDQIKKSGIAYTIIKEYPLSSEKLIKLGL